MFILIMVMYMGSFTKNDANAIAVAEFSNQSNCEEAGRAISSKSSGGNKNFVYVCARK